MVVPLTGEKEFESRPEHKILVPFRGSFKVARNSIFVGAPSNFDPPSHKHPCFFLHTPSAQDCFVYKGWKQSLHCTKEAFIISKIVVQILQAILYSTT